MIEPGALGFEAPVGVGFEEPLALALPAAAALLAALLARFRKRRSRPVRYLDLWRIALEDAGWTERGYRALRRAGRVALALAVLSLSAALARPRVRWAGGARFAVVVDLSASMSARDARGATRLGSALEEVRRWSGGRPARDRYVLVAAGVFPRGLERGTIDRTELHAALERLDVQGAAGRIGEAVDRSREKGLEPVLFTDGAFPEDPRLEAVPRFVVGGETPNAGFVSLDVRAEPLRDLARIRFAVRNFDRGESRYRVILERAGQDPRTIPLVVQAGKSAEGEVEVPRGAGGLAVLRLEPGDGFAADGVVAARIRPRTSHPLVLVGGAAEDPVLRPLALALASGMDVGRAERPLDVPPGSVAILAGGEWDLAGSSAAGWLAFGARLVGLSGAPVDSPGAVVEVDRGHPWLADLEWENLRVARSLATDARAVVSAENGPLVVEGEIAGAHLLATTFALEESNFPLLAAFPLLVRRAAAAWTGETVLEPSYVRTGRPPDGVPLSAFAGAPLAAPMESLRLRLPAGEGALPANLLDPQESDLHLRRPAGWTGTPAPGPGVEEDATASLLLLAAAALVARVLAAAAAGLLESIPRAPSSLYNPVPGTPPGR